MDGKTVSVEPNESSVESTFTKGTSCTKIGARPRLPSKLEDNVEEVKDILTRGCSCPSKNCLIFLDAESVYTHRKNMFGLNRLEHDIFLRGALMTCMAGRRGLTQNMVTRYIYRSRRVCEESFLYLQCCTIQQLNDNQNHLINSGVFPIIHPDQSHVKRRLLFCNSHKWVKAFLDEYLEEHVGKENINNGEHIFLPLGTTKISLHKAYTEYVQRHNPGGKLMTCNSFRKFLAAHFPHIVFCRFGGTMTQTQPKNRKPINVQDMPLLTVVPLQNQVRIFEDPGVLHIPDLFGHATIDGQDMPSLTVAPLPNQVGIFEDLGVLPDLLGPTTIIQIFENSDQVELFSSDELVISDL